MGYQRLNRGFKMRKIMCFAAPLALFLAMEFYREYRLLKAVGVEPWAVFDAFKE